jgi:hypothetical protein
MEKERITKDDGRYLIFYRFDREKHMATDDGANLSKNKATPCDGCGGTSPSIDVKEAEGGQQTCQN